MHTIDTPDRLQEVASAIAWSSSVKDPERLASMATGFATGRSSELYACFEDNRIAGIVALDTVDGSVVTVRQIGVHPSKRRHGTGRRMLEHIAAVHADGSLRAETDRDAVDFYRTLGFHIESLGEKYPGTERFRCTWPPLKNRRPARVVGADATRGYGYRGLRVRAMTGPDIPHVAELYVSVFSAPPWNEDHGVDAATKSLETIADHPSFHGIVGSVEDQTVGAVLGYCGEGDSARRYSLRELFVDVAYQRHGIGSTLVEALEHQLRGIGVTTISLITASDSAAHGFCAAQGYREVSRRVILEKDLGAPPDTVSG